MGFFVDSAEIRCTGIKFILNTFESCCDGCSVVSDENVSSPHQSTVEKDNLLISISTYFLSPLVFSAVKLFFRTITP